MNTFKIVFDGIQQFHHGHHHGHDDDCGLDLVCPEEGIIIPPKAISFEIDLEFKGAMYDPNNKNVGYMLVPRSSMGSKTPLRMSNSIGIIDPGYRGNLKVYIDNISDKEYSISMGQRLFQIVCFNGLPIKTEVVRSLDTTERGEGGFGSTGN